MSNKELSEKLAETFYFTEEAHAMLTSFCLQLGWTEEQYQEAVKEIDVEYLKSRFVGRILDQFNSDEEVEQMIAASHKLNAILSNAYSVIPEGLDKYLEDNNLLDGQQEENLH